MERELSLIAEVRRAVFLTVHDIVR